MRIFLIGMMGCGKSTVGKRLAARLNFSFYDLDVFIEQKLNATIAEIFREKGESFFRKEEMACLHELLSIEKAVIATGGGTPCFFDNMQRMKTGGICIYLEASPQLLFSRLTKQKNARPLLAGLENEQLKNFLAEKLSERMPFYAQAHYRVAATNVRIGELAKMVGRL